jgi:multidrug efflux pump subunit AcrB
MNLTHSALKKPAVVIVLVVLVMVFGVISIFKLPLQLIPDIEYPQITISTGWRNAAPAEIESVIVEPIESVVKNTPGVIKVTSSIQRGSGKIVLLFDVGANMQKAMLDVINNLNQAPPLPLDAMEPILSTDSGPNIASLMIKTLPDNPEHDLGRYQKLIEDVVKPRFSRIPGMGQVNLESHRPRELRITFDPMRAASLGLTLSAISSAIANANDVSAGIANVGKRQYTVRFSGQFNIDNLSEMIIGYSSDRPIYLKDIATVENTLVDRTEFYLRNGQPSYYFTLRRQYDANTVALLDEINIAIKELNEGPMAEAGLAIDLSFDASVHIRNALNLVQSNLGVGVLLSLFVMWCFLRGLKTVLVIALTIPIPLMIALAGLNLCGRTLNVISLAGLAFSIGMGVDAAIIVQENIARLRSLGADTYKSVLRGTMEVAPALFASTVTSIAIFIPILFMAGIEGQLFSDLALTLSITLIASYLVAVTLLPIMSRAWLYNVNISDPYQYYWQRLALFLMHLTNSARKQAMWILTLLGGSLLISILLMPKTDFMPRAPIDGFFMNLNMSPGGNVQFIEEEIAGLIKERLDPYFKGEKQPKIKSYNFVSYNAATTMGYIYADDPTRVEELMDVVRNQVMIDLPDVRVSLTRGSMISVSGGSNGRTIDMDINGPDIESLMAVAKIGIAMTNEHFTGATVIPTPTLNLAEPELDLIPNDQRITQTGLTRRDLANAIKAYTSGLFIGEFFDGNVRENIMLRGQQWNTPDELAALPVYTPLAGVQNLGELTSIVSTVGPSQLRRVNGMRTISLQITPPNKMSLEEAQAIMNEKILPKMNEHLDSKSSIMLTGNANKMTEAIIEMVKNFLLALLILFLLMAAMFKSIKDSFLVLLVMPVAMAGGILGLLLLNLFTFQSLDLLTMIGFIILLGLVVNNAILLVDQTRQGQKEGLSIDEAVANAICIRAKPIYMSTLTSLFGMLPLMVVPGVGSEIYRGLATVIVGGMAFSALFTLVLFPSLLRLEHSRFARRSAKIFWEKLPQWVRG